eukprot:9555464-Heterocapsa_arctica.AAC.1
MAHQPASHPDSQPASQPSLVAPDPTVQGAVTIFQPHTGFNLHGTVPQGRPRASVSSYGVISLPFYLSGAVRGVR